MPFGVNEVRCEERRLTAFSIGFSIAEFANERTWLNFTRLYSTVVLESRSKGRHCCGQLEIETPTRSTTQARV
jgi:hypothetical protein